VWVYLLLHTRTLACKEIARTPTVAPRDPKLSFPPRPEDPWCSGTSHGPTSPPGKSVYAVVTEL